MRLPLHRRHSLAAASLLALAAHGPVTAQPIPSEEAAEADAGRTNDIIVTAQRREQRLQDVPITVSVVSADTLAAAGVGETESLLAVIPGLVNTRQLKGSTPFIRGIGTQSGAPGVESPVALYVDGVYFMNPNGNIFALNNIQRVEVLKGPQGTLFGRNTTGGLIHVVTRDPEAGFSLNGSLNYGNYDTKEGALYVTGGSDVIAADLALYGVRSDGYGKYLNIGGDANYVHETAGRAKILWRPGTNTRVTLSADYTNNQGDMGLTRNAVPGSRILTNLPFRGTIYDTQSGTRSDVDIDSWGASLRIQHDLGDVSLQSITAYRRVKASAFFDQDAVPARFADVAFTDSNRTFQQELLLNGQMGRLNWTGGLFFLAAKSLYDPLAVRSIAPPNNFDIISPQRLRSYAGFVDGTFAITDSTNVTAGVRYTIDERRFQATQTAMPGHPAPGTIIASRNDKATFKKLTWRAVVDQKLGEDVLLFASFNRGFKAGVFNASAILQPVIRPEVVDAFEVGLKSDLLDRLLRLNVSAYHTVAKDIQLTRQTLGAQTIFNAAKGRVNGIEVETILSPRMPTGDLSVFASFTYMDAKYTSFPLGQITVPSPTGANLVQVADLTGREMIRSPDWTFSAGIDYTVPIGEAELGFSGNYYHSDGFFWEPDNRLRQVPYDLLSAQLSYSFGRDHRYRVRLFGKNLLDEEYHSYANAGGLGDLAAPAPPRTYGVGFDFRF